MSDLRPTSDPGLQALRRARTLAGGLLVGMGGITLLGYALPQAGMVGDAWWLAWLRAGGRAGLVGGLADWFAVTALFRHPLGLPIPHTAILPRQKDRLGAALGRFVAGHFFTEEEVARAVAGVDLAGLIADNLERPDRREAAGRALRGALPAVFERIEDGRASSAISRTLVVMMQGDDLAPLIARALRALVESDYHQEVLSFLLARIKDGVRDKDEALRAMIAERVREQGGSLLGWAIGGSIAGKVMHALNQELERIDPRDSSLREGFSDWARAEVERIEHDPARRREIADAIAGVLTHDSLKAWSGDLWRRARGMAEDDIGRDDGWTQGAVDAALLQFADLLRNDAGTRARLDQGVARCVAAMLPKAREKLSGFIATVAEKWDGVAFAERIELRVGPDLQFIRVNGTLVGFIVGIALEIGLRAVFGRD